VQTFTNRSLPNQDAQKRDRYVDHATRNGQFGETDVADADDAQGMLLERERKRRKLVIGDAEAKTEEIVKQRGLSRGFRKAHLMGADKLQTVQTQTSSQLCQINPAAPGDG